MSLLARVKNKIHAAKYSAMMAPIVVVWMTWNFTSQKLCAGFLASRWWASRRKKKDM
jgi:hypothetical protein